MGEPVLGDAVVDLPEVVEGVAVAQPGTELEDAVAVGAAGVFAAAAAAVQPAFDRFVPQALPGLALVVAIAVGIEGAEGQGGIGLGVGEPGRGEGRRARDEGDRRRCVLVLVDGDY